MLRYQGFEVEKNYDFTLGCLACESLRRVQAKLAGGNSMLRYQGFEVEKNYDFTLGCLACESLQRVQAKLAGS